MMLWVDGNDDGAVITTAAWLLIIMIIQKNDDNVRRGTGLALAFYIWISLLF